MEIKKIHDGLSVSPQIETGDLNAIMKAGFKAIICNRPDSEAEDQPSFALIEAAANKLGLSASYLPIRPGLMSEADIDEFEALLARLRGPVLAYCRTGTRSEMLWTQCEARAQHIEATAS